MVGTAEAAAASPGRPGAEPTPPGGAPIAPTSSPPLPADEHPLPPPPQINWDALDALVLNFLAQEGRVEVGPIRR